MHGRKGDARTKGRCTDERAMHGRKGDDMAYPAAGRFVAIGDSFTEGVGDPSPRYPNGYRGWADRMARQLGRADPTWEYANLALRSRLLDEVVAHQLEPALALEPTHVSF